MDCWPVSAGSARQAEPAGTALFYLPLGKFRTSSPDGALQLKTEHYCSSSVTKPSRRAWITRPVLSGTGRPGAAYFARIRIRWVLIVPANGHVRLLVGGQFAPVGRTRFLRISGHENSGSAAAKQLIDTLA